MKRLLFIFTILSAVVMTSCHKGLSSKYPVEDMAFVDSFKNAMVKDAALVAYFANSTMEFDDGDYCLVMTKKLSKKESANYALAVKVQYGGDFDKLFDAARNNYIEDIQRKEADMRQYKKGISMKSIFYDNEGNYLGEFLITPDDVLP